jgi:molybdenum cofactor biosynthesis enzyme MoaA
MSKKAKNTDWRLQQLTKDEFVQFVDQAKNGERHQKAFIGLMTIEAAKRIKNLCGATVSRIMIESDVNIKVSDKDHQSNKVLIFQEDNNGIITFLAEVRTNGEWVAFMDCWRQRKSR